MKTWEVTVPIAGSAFLTVQAETEEEAIRLALDEATIDDIGEWEALEHITQGNVCYAPQRHAEATCVGEDDQP